MTGAAHILAHMQDFTSQVNQLIGVGSVCEDWPETDRLPTFVVCALASMENTLLLAQRIAKSA